MWVIINAPWYYAQKVLSWRLTHAVRTVTGIRMTSRRPIEIPRAER